MSFKDRNGDKFWGLDSREVFSYEKRNKIYR